MRTKKSKSKKSGSVVADLINAVRIQERTIDKLLNSIKTGGAEIVETATRTKRAYRRRKATSLEPGSKEAKKSNNEFFLESLKQIGRPATTWEIANRLKKLNPYFKSLSRDKKRFMQVVYSSAYQLSKEGLLKRKPLGKKSFEYTVQSKKAA